MYLELTCFLVHTFVLMRHCFVEHRTDLTISTHRTFWKLHFTWNYWKEKKTHMNQKTGFCLYICFKWKSHLKIWLLAWLHHYCNNASWQWNLIWFIPLKWCNICQSNAFLGWAAELSMWIGGYSPPVISLKKHDILAIEPYLYERTKHSHNSLAPLLHYLGHKLL